MKQLSIIGIFTLALACGTSEDKAPVSTDIQVVEPTNVVKVSTDTTLTSYPMRIANDRGTLYVTSIKQFENQELTDSRFNITLDGFNDYNLNTEIDVKTLLEDTRTSKDVDSTAVNYLESAVIKELKYDFIRSNSLYFQAFLEHPNYSQDRVYRFGLFYRTKKEGSIFGRLVLDTM